jgi:hypothetical protein
MPDEKKDHEDSPFSRFFEELFGTLDTQRHSSSLFRELDDLNEEILKKLYELAKKYIGNRPPGITACRWGMLRFQLGLKLYSFLWKIRGTRIIHKGVDEKINNFVLMNSIARKTVAEISSIELKEIDTNKRTEEG